MTDDRRESDRRDEDVRLAQLLAAMEVRFTEEWKRADAVHLELAAHTHPEIERLIYALEGEPKVMPSGTVRYAGGLISEVQQLTKQLGNGGLRIKLPPMAWAAIIAAIITGIFNFWGILVSRMGA